jgi:Holliday junction resolvasome RuvABC DNA-binding subunit
MIKTEREYKTMLAQLDQEERNLEEQRIALTEAGLNESQLQAAMNPLLSFRDQLKEEIDFYEKIMRKDFSALQSFDSIGRLLIALRIASNVSQHELALRLQVSDSQVSRDERDEYYGATVQKLTAVLKALGYRAQTSIEAIGPSTEPECALG